MSTNLIEEHIRTGQCYKLRLGDISFITNKPSKEYLYKSGIKLHMFDDFNLVVNGMEVFLFINENKPKAFNFAKELSK